MYAAFHRVYYLVLGGLVVHCERIQLLNVLGTPNTGQSPAVVQAYKHLPSQVACCFDYSRWVHRVFPEMKAAYSSAFEELSAFWALTK